MTLLPHQTPDEPSPPRDPAVQRVDVVRAGGAGPAGANDLGQTFAALGERTAAVFGTGTRRFFGTVKWMLLLGVGLALAAAWWAENGRVLRGVLAALLVFGPVAVIAVVAAGQRAAAAVAAETWRQAGLARQVLGLLLDRVAAAPDVGQTDDGLPVAAVPHHRLPLSEAELRLRRAVDGWAAERPGGDGLEARLVGRGQRRLAELVSRFAVSGFRAHARSAGGVVDVPAVRAALADRVDDWVAGRVRAKARGAVAGAVVAAVAWGVVVAYAVGRLWVG